VFYCYWLTAVDSTDLCQFRAHYNVVSFPIVFSISHVTIRYWTERAVVWHTRRPASYPTLCYQKISVTSIRALPSGTVNFVLNSRLKKKFATSRRPSKVLSTVDRRPSPVYHTEHPDQSNSNRCLDMVNSANIHRGP